jgi:hypothetical protein
LPKNGSSAKQKRRRALIDEATVECYNEYEKSQGFINMLEERVTCPFTANLGPDVVR